MCKRLLWVILGCLLLPGLASAATRYVTSVACANTYQVGSNSCGGASGVSSYTTIAAALSASAAGDTMRFRTGSYATPGGGIWPLSNQIWEGCRAAVCGTDETATITAGGQTHIITFDDGAGDVASNVTFRYLTLTGGVQGAINISGVSGLTLDTLDISGFNTSCVTIDLGYPHGISLAGADTTVSPMPAFLVQNVTVHDAASCPGLEWAGIAVGGPSTGGTIKNSTVSGANISDGIWLDVQSGAPNRGFTPHIIEGNTVANTPRICYHIEDESSWILRKNIGYGCSEGVRARPGNPTMAGQRFYNNTLYDTTVAVWITNDPGTEDYTDSQFKNNIFLNNSSSRPTIVFSDDYQTDTTNLFANNLVRNLNASGAAAVCWGGAGPGFDPSNCNSPGVEYTNAQMSTWNGSASADNNLSAVPIFANAAGGDFRLCTAAGVPAAGCSGASPGIDQGVDVGLAYNGAAPDVGALETAGGDTTAPPAPGNLRVVQP